MKLVTSARNEKTCTSGPMVGLESISAWIGSVPKLMVGPKLPSMAASQARNMRKGSPVPTTTAVRILEASPCIQELKVMQQY